MTAQKNTTESKKPFVISRTFDAPLDLVWKAWTERERMMEWFGPKGFTMSTAKMDFRPGGIFHYALRGPDGKEMWGKWIYREIVPMQKIVLISMFSNEKGEITRHPMSATWPRETFSTTTFAEKGGKTTVTITWEAYNADAEEQKTFDDSHSGMNAGWGGTFEQLDAYLAKKKLTTKLVITREFDAPRDVVFKAFIDTKEFAKWWGPKYWTNPRCELDPRPGGKIFDTMQGPDGSSHVMGGHFVEISPPGKVVFVTTAFPDANGEPMIENLNTVTLEEIDRDKTKLTLDVVVQKFSPAIAPALGGMGEGWSTSLDKLFDLVSGAKDREMVIERDIDAPRDLVWEALTDPKHMIHWWGPNGFTNTFLSIDVRPGGEWIYIMHGPDGTNYDNYVRFTELLKPHRISYDHGTKKGEPFMFRSVITLEQCPGTKTRVTLKAILPTAAAATEAKKYAVEGGKQTLGRLAEYVLKMR